jgi:hypothetical protein
MNVNGKVKRSSTVTARIGAGVLAVGAMAAVFGAGTATATPVPGNPSGYHADHVVPPQQGLGPQGHGTVFTPGSALPPGNVSDDANTAPNSGPSSAAPIDSGDHPRSDPGFDRPVTPF